MSRHLPGQQRRLPSTVDNPYQVTTLPSTSNGYKPQALNGYYHHQARNTGFDALLSDDTFTDSNTYYEYFNENENRTSPRKEKKSDCMFSDDSGSTKLPYYEYESVSPRRHSRNSSSDRSYNKKAQQLYRNNSFNPAQVHKDPRRVYPNQEPYSERLCPESQRYLNSLDIAPVTTFPRRSGHLSRISDRPQSSQSSGVASAIVDGCGGHCQTFENVCYYFLQVAFTMGILIGASLCIAGALLRKSAARNLQVLVYIGALLFFVSCLLLGVQCSARRAARRRKKALRNAKRGAIPLETLPRSHVFQAQQQLPLVEPTQRNMPVTFLPVSGNPQSQRPINPGNTSLEEQNGIPWWRRNEITSNF